MKVSTWKRQQRHLQARRAYWASVYTQNGLRRVPLPFVECYNEEGEIIPLPPFEWVKGKPLLNILPRQAGSTVAVNWKPIVDAFTKAQEQAG